MKYIYTAVITNEKPGYYFVRVPDLKGCISSGKTIEDAIDMITDAASLWLVAAEDEGLTIPKPSPQDDVKKTEDELYTLVRIDTISYRSMTETKSVRKNVSLPAWMSRLADKRKINCSKLLQNALLSEFSKE